MIETLAFRYVAVGILLFLTILLIVILRHIRLERNSLKSSPPLHDKITSAKSEDPRSPNDISTYEDLYFKERYIKDRAAVYISGDTKRKILSVVRRIGSDRMTVTSYVENILRPSPRNLPRGDQRAVRGPQLRQATLNESSDFYFIHP